MQLVRALSHPGDRLAWLSVLRAPYCGLTLESLQRLFGADHVTPVPVLLERALRIVPAKTAPGGFDAAAGLAQGKRPDCTEVAQQGALFEHANVAPQGSLFDHADAAPQGSLFDNTQAPPHGSLFDDTEAPPQGDPSADTPSAPLAQTLLRPDEYARLRQVAMVLLDTRNASGAMPFAAWVEALWRRLGGPALYSGPSVATDAESLFQLVERLAPHGAIDPAALDAGIARLFAAPDAADEEAAVEIMTMHKSKGLQFDTVILYGLHRAPRGDQPPLVRFEQSGGRVLFGPCLLYTSDAADE